MNVQQSEILTVDEATDLLKISRSSIHKLAQNGKIPAQPSTIQESFTDFGLYKCEACGKMVMGFEKDNYAKAKHRGQKVEWKKVR
jgi:hypothetical protein